MKDAILDIVRHSASLGFFNLAKITGDTSETILWTCDDDRSVVLDAKLKNPHPGLVGEFGLGSLSFLNGVSSLYNKENSTVDILAVTKNGVTVPDYIEFRDNEGNYDKYRLMSKELIDQELEQTAFKGTKWDISFEPKKSKLSEMASKAAIYSSIEPTFTIKTENNNLIFIFGSDMGGSHFGQMVFANDVTGNINEGYAWPIDKFLAILKLGMVGQCTVQFNKIACMITIDSGIGVYNYILPGHSR